MHVQQPSRYLIPASVRNRVPHLLQCCEHVAIELREERGDGSAELLFFYGSEGSVFSIRSNAYSSSRGCPRQPLRPSLPRARCWDPTRRSCWPCSLKAFPPPKFGTDTSCWIPQVHRGSPWGRSKRWSDPSRLSVLLRPPDHYSDPKGPFLSSSSKSTCTGTLSSAALPVPLTARRRGSARTTPSRGSAVPGPPRAESLGRRPGDRRTVGRSDD